MGASAARDDHAPLAALHSVSSDRTAVALRGLCVLAGASVRHRPCLSRFRPCRYRGPAVSGQRLPHQITDIAPYAITLLAMIGLGLRRAAKVMRHV